MTKMGGKDILKALSPIANLSGDNAGFAVGLLPGLMYKDYKKNKAEEEAEKAKGMPAGAVPGMKKGGKVASASKRADGIAKKGKTRGKMY
jgi:hypothetical protein